MIAIASAAAGRRALTRQAAFHPIEVINAFSKFAP
jgi:hypothetical protein